MMMACTLFVVISDYYYESTCRYYAEFNDAGKYTKMKREYRSGKKCRNTKHRKIPILEAGGWPQN